MGCWSEQISGRSIIFNHPKWMMMSNGIADHKRAEEKLRESEQQWSETFDAISDSICLIDPDGRILRHNQATQHMLGKSAGELNGHFCFEVVHDTTQPIANCSFIRMKETHRRESATIQLGDRWLEITTDPILDNDQRLTAAVHIIKDITDHKKAEDALKESEEKYRDLVERAHDGTTIIQEGLVRYANPALAKMWGGSVEEIIGRPFTDFLHPDERSVVAERYRRRMAGEAIHSVYDTKLKDKEGRDVYAQLNSGIIAFQGLPANFVIVHDITERKRTDSIRERFLVRQEQLNLLQQTMLSPGKLDMKLKKITDSVVEIFGADFCRIWITNPGDLCEVGCVHAAVTEGPHVCRYRDRCLRLYASSGRYTHTDGEVHRRVPFGCYKIGRVASGDEHKFLTNDVQNDLRVHNREWAKEIGLVSFAGYQLRPPDGETLGVFALFSKQNITVEEDSQLDSLSNTITRVIQTAWVDEELRAFKTQMEFILGATKTGLDVIDAEFNIRYIDPEWQKVYGDPTGRKCYDYFMGRDSPCPGCGAVKALQTRSPVVTEKALVKEGSRQVQVTTMPFQNDAGEWLVAQVNVDINERQKAEEALQYSEMQYRSLAENSPDLIARFDRKYRHLYVNATAAKAGSYSPEGYVGKTIAEVGVPEQEARRWEERIRTVFETGQAVDVEDTFETPYGPRYFNTKFVPEIAAGGLVQSVQSIARDITERKKVGDALRESERRLADIIDFMPDATIVIDREGKIIAWNRAIEEMTGVPKEEMIDKSGYAYAVPFLGEPRAILIDLVFRDMKEIEKKYYFFMRKGDQLIAEAFAPMLNRGTGAYLWGIAAPLYDRDGSIVGAIQSIRDITERKKAEDMLQKRESLLNEVGEMAHVGGWELDVRTKSVLWTKETYRIHDVSRDEKFDLSNAVLFYDLPGRSILEAALQRCMEKGEPFDLELPFTNAKGRHLWTRAMGRAVSSVDGTIVKLTGTFQDTTKRKLAEEALAKKSEDLARSNADLAQFAYVASHDLKEPLRMVTSYVQLLEMRYKGKLDPDADEFIGYVVEGTKRMKQLLNALLDYSRVGTRGHPLQTVESEKVLKTALQNLKIVLEETKATVTHDPLPVIIADETQMVQLFQNLIGNGLKFHGPQPPSIHVSAKQEGTNWIFSFQDNGIGIDPQYFEKIFVIFQRLHARDKYPGTGIGLAIATKIVEQHGGRIWVESEKEKGSTFYFTIPVDGVEEGRDI